MQSFKPIRVKQAAQFLGVSSSTVRAWCNTGRLPYSLSAVGQRIFDQRELEAFKNKRLGTPTEVYSDKASGLNENRRGLNRLLRDAAEPDSTITRICVTNKDRLTRFGFHYLDVFFSHLGVSVEVLDSDDTKEPPRSAHARFYEPTSLVLREILSPTRVGTTETIPSRRGTRG